MITPGLPRLEPRQVVLATVADARMSEASSEFEELQERMRQVTAEVEALEQSARTAPSQVEFPESAQLALQFVDDLVSTNRERMRDQVSQRYAWAGERLTGAHAEAQALVGEALAELTAAMREHDASREHHLDDLPLAALMVSIAPVAPGTPSSPTVEPGSFVHDPSRAVERLVGEVEAPGSLNGVVDSAVKAILTALTEPGNEAQPLPTSAPASQSGPPANGVFQALADGAPETLPSESTAAPEQPAPSFGDDPEPLPVDIEGVGDAVLAQGYGDFWGDQAKATDSRESGESRESRFKPRDLMIGMVILVALILVALAFIG